MQETLRLILEEAVNAPSGDNSQPWEFCVKENSIWVWNIAGADDTLYNFRQRGSYLAHGTVIENIVILATKYGKASTVTLFPRSNTSDLIAKISFSEYTGSIDTLSSFVSERTTNRKPYDTRKLSDGEKKSFVNIVAHFEWIGFSLLEDPSVISSLAKVLSLNERLILENRGIHDYLFSFIRWSEEEEREKGGGMHIKSLELSTPQEKAFRLFRQWRVVSMMNRLFGVARLVARDNVKLYAATPAYGLLFAHNKRPVDFVESGRCFQRIWLTATSVGLSLQPTTALLYLAQRIHEEEEESLFTVKQRELILKAESDIKNSFGITYGVPVMLFRIGKSSPASVKSYKRPPLILTDAECATRGLR